MANPDKRLPANVPGEFYVDATCIDCGTCRELAAASFAEGPDQSYVHAQPTTPEATRQAWHALLSCPTASIGTMTAAPDAARAAMADFPLPVDGGVHRLGFTSPKSFGGASYWIVRPEGNWMVDSPRHHPALFMPMAARGGLTDIFLTHRDDVADAARYAAHFKARRWIGEADADAQPEAEQHLSGDLPVTLAPGCVAIPTPGHTRGHWCLLVDDRYLFTGDHLWGEFPPGQAPADAEGRLLGAGRGVCWHSWDEQIRSMESLLAHRFEWVLPGHGHAIHLEAPAMRRELEALIGRMRASG
jgi:glyoxylase-like metal-dependent hydrolase (beta-lactamase superfamily II)/ferredoxin